MVALTRRSYTLFLNCDIELLSRNENYATTEKASVVATVEPVLAAVWDYLLFRQAPDATTLTAYALITAAAVIASLGSRRQVVGRRLAI